MCHTCPLANQGKCDDHRLFRCPNTLKCISKHRLVDGIEDCLGGFDEKVDACEFDPKNRFRCSSERKCLSPRLVQNGMKDCVNGEDERNREENELSFWQICNEYIHIEDQNETDENNCAVWPCSNQYTHCDGPPSCLNYADEMNCSLGWYACPPNHYPCVTGLSC